MSAGLVGSSQIPLILPGLSDYSVPVLRDFITSFLNFCLKRYVQKVSFFFNDYILL